MKKTLLALAAVTAAFALHAGAAFAATIWAAGDGADSYAGDDGVAAMIKSQGPFNKFLYLGDVYDNGTAQEFANYYQASYGQFKTITAPTPGNHETANILTGYDPYWGSLAPKSNGGHYYSFDISGWHIVSLDSEESYAAGSPQVTWLHNDLANYPGTCTLAYWHRPRYSAALGGGDSTLAPLWSELAGHATVALAGHHHDYQRLIPINGVTEFIVGTGGHFFHTIDRSYARLVAGEDTAYGALRMNLTYGHMDYQFIESDGTVFDQGSMPCTPHTSTPPPNEPPTAGFDFSPTAPVTNQTVGFSSSSADPDGQIVSWEWDLDGDGQFDDAVGATASWKFTSQGTKTVSLRVTDDQGATSVATRQLTVGNQPPSASFTWSPSAPVKRDKVTFTSTSADADGSIASQAWDLDDNGKFDNGTGPTATKTFNKEGNYTVRLRVVDNQGASSISSQTVTVYKTRPPGAAKRVAPPFTKPAFGHGPRVRILSPLPSRFYNYQPKVLLGSSRGAGEPVRLILRRSAGRRCYTFDSLRFHRGSCRSRRSFAAGGRAKWRFKLPIDLPRGSYRLTAIVRAANGRLTAQSVGFRVYAPVKVRQAPIETGEDQHLEPGSGDR